MKWYILIPMQRSFWVWMQMHSVFACFRMVINLSLLQKVMAGSFMLSALVVQELSMCVYRHSCCELLRGTTINFHDLWYSSISWSKTCKRYAPYLYIKARSGVYFVRSKSYISPTPHKTYRTRAPAIKPGSSWGKVYIESSHSPFKSQIYSNSIDRVVLCQGVWYYDHMTSKSCRKS